MNITFNKMHKSISSTIYCLLLAGVVQFSVGAPAHAADAEIRQLLNQIKKGQALDSKVDQKRIREFTQQKSKQKQLLVAERKTNKRLESRADVVEKAYNDGEKELTAVREQFIARLGSLKELFGVLQGASGDLRATLFSSITQAENRLNNPDDNRVDFLADFGSRMSGDNLPAIEELERLWWEFSSEIVASGEVRRFAARVQQGDGQIVDAPVVRVGLFNIVGDSGYLSYRDNQEHFNVLLRQPPSRYQEAARELSLLPDGAEAISFPVDPTRGQLLGLLVDLPTMRERIDQGGTVGYLILLLGLVAAFLSIYRFARLRGYHTSIEKQRKAMDKPDPKNPLGFVLSIYNKNRTQTLETLELKLEEGILAQTPKFTKNLAFIKIIAVVAPLMGLLGTVTGMIITFQSITQFGAGDPKLMAGGISQALVTTVLGLVVAIPTVFLHSILSAQARGLTQFLEERVTALVADYAAAATKRQAPPPTATA